MEHAAAGTPHWEWQENGFVCPFLEKSNPRCSSHLNIRNIGQAYAHCAGRYQACPVFRELRAHPCTHDYSRHRATYSFLAAS